MTGIVGAAGGLGGFFRPLVMGAVRQTLGSYTVGFVLLALTSLLCLVLNQRAMLNRQPERLSQATRARSEEHSR